MPGRYLKESGIITQFRNCRLLREHAIIEDDLWVRNGRIVNPEKLFFEELAYADVQIDCKDAILAPGFIDVQINGAFGVDFSRSSDNLRSEVARVSKGLLPHGVTSYCPTLITLPPEEYSKILPHFERRDGGKHGAGILGVHLEGPFISKEKRGAHPEEHVRSLEGGISTVEKVYGSLEKASIVTMAPELPEANSVIDELVSRGITVSLGHSTANLSQGEEAVKHGATFITHLFNAMLPFHHRDPHLVGLLASSVVPTDRPVYYGMIADGIHTHPAALRIAHRTYPKGLVLVTDAVPAMGLATGKHHIGSQVVEIKDKRALIAGTNTLCGSIASMNECVKYFYNATECSPVDALEAASLHPAEALGIDHRKGSLAYETDADFILLDDNLTVEATFIGGELVWKSEQSRDLTLHMLYG